MSLRTTVSLVDADSYFASRLRSGIWDAADEGMKTQALNQASFLISGAFEFYETAYEIDDNGDVTWDERIIAAVCEEALWLMKRDPSEVPEALFNGIVSASAGSVSATFDKSFVIPWICEAAKTLVGDLGVFIDDDSEGTMTTSLLAM